MAMGEKIKELTLIDDILAPKDTIVINFKGKDPYKVVLSIQKLLVGVVKLETKDVYETDSRWNLIADPRDFYSVWIAKKEEDKWSTTVLRVIIQGAQSMKDKTGWTRIELKGNLITKYKFSNFFQRSFWWFYNKMFYYKQRRIYIELRKDNLHEVRNMLMDSLGIRLHR
jgi:hypothetical protein